LSAGELLLQRGEEALGDGVVKAVAAAADRPGDADLAAGLTEGEQDELPGLNRSSTTTRVRIVSAPGEN